MKRGGGYQPYRRSRSRRRSSVLARMQRGATAYGRNPANRKRQLALAAKRQRRGR